MTKILFFTNYFPPAYKAGGPIQSGFNLINALEPIYNFTVFTNSRDIDHELIVAVESTNKLIGTGKYSTFFFDGNFFLRKLYSIFKITRPDVIYINGFFNFRFNILPVIFANLIVPKTGIIIIPTGMFKSTAINNKRIKKMVFIAIAKLFNVYKNTIWHATNREEANEIKKIFISANIFVIDNLPPPIQSDIQYIEKQCFHIKLVFVGRVHPIKNLLFFFECLQKTNTSMELVVVGIIEDKAYFRLLKIRSESFSDNIKISFTGALEHDQIRNELINAHLFVLPTQGENYGYAIIEALSVGRPVLISDRTPWKNLSNYNAGWELPLNDKQAWIDKINEAAAWNQETFDKHCEGALAYAKAHTNNEELVKKYIEMFGGVTAEDK